MFNVYRKMWAAAGIVLCLFSAVFAYSDGNGTPADPCQIRNVSDWQHLMNTPTDWSKYFIMTADLNLQGVTLTPVGNSTTTFTGVFDGDGYVVYNAIINTPSNTYVGLFGCVGNAGRISYLGVEDVNITALSYAGGLAGRNYGGIAKCYVTGTVTTSATYSGGIAGRNDGNIIDCYATDSVKGSSDVGGLVGSNGSSVSDVNTSYSTGLVTGSGSYVGGLVGYNYGDVINSFWDVNTSGKSTSAGGTGKTTAEMHDINTFLNAHWDFTTPIWKISNGNYPKLDWQGITGDFVSPDGVGPEDLAFFVQRWLDTNCAVTNNCNGTDLNTDGTVNFLDFALFANNWLEGKD
ncbi:MAG: GLUG motif-containing protein [Sedimentisphaerales bacterium]